MDSEVSFELMCPACRRRAPGARAGARCPRDDHLLVARRDLAHDRDDPVLGTMIAGKYAVIGVLGRGGFGDVYTAVQEPVGRLVALKLIRRSQRADAATRDRFFREARLVARLTSRATAVLHDFGADADGTLYMALERVEGRTLEEVLRAGPLASGRVVRILAEILRALAEAHRLGIVHRDLKPANLMLTHDALGHETVKLLDFGVAKTIAGEGQPEGPVVGTPSYMAPEQIRGDAVDGRADLYALGCLAYALLAGRPPFEAVNPMELLLQQLDAEPPAFAPSLGVPEGLQAVVRRAMAKDPAERFPSATAMLAALGTLPPGPGTAPGPPSTPPGAQPTLPLWPASGATSAPRPPADLAGWRRPTAGPPARPRLPWGRRPARPRGPRIARRPPADDAA